MKELTLREMLRQCSFIHPYSLDTGEVLNRSLVTLLNISYASISSNRGFPEWSHLYHTDKQLLRDIIKSLQILSTEHNLIDCRVRPRADKHIRISAFDRYRITKDEWQELYKIYLCSNCTNIVEGIL